MPDVLPPLYRRHKNFFVASTALAFFHLGLGLLQILDADRYQGLAFSDMYEYIPMRIWGWASIGVWVLMTVGVYTDKWFVAKIGIGIGLSLCLLRAYFYEIADTPAVGAAVVVWLFLASIHYVQIAEPPEKPIYVTERE